MLRTAAVILVLLSASGCAADTCVERIAHGPWEPVGDIEAPRRGRVAEVFARGGATALRSELGAPSMEEGGRVVWVFETRSVSERQRCSPPSTTALHDQVFSIVEVSQAGGEERCFLEVREVLSESARTFATVDDIPRTSLGTGPVACDGTPAGTGMDGNGADPHDGDVSSSASRS